MLTNQEIVAGLEDEHLKNLQENYEAGNFGEPGNAAYCAVGCAVNPATETNIASRMDRYNTAYFYREEAERKSLRKLEHAYMRSPFGHIDRLLAAELYDLVLIERASRTLPVKASELITV